ncbi:MAG: ECF transporter S component [Faecousia sp.]
MKQKKLDTRYMATLAMLCGVLLVMGITGIGFIPFPVIKATTMHIPVILGAVLLGPSAGGVLGGVFGLCSIWVNTTSPGLLSFAFSPFMTTEGLPGVVKSLWIALGCRILFGIIAGWLWKLLKKILKQDYAALPVTAAVSTLCHTILVMGSIYFLLAQQYAEAKNVAITAVFGLVMGTVTASGIPEAIIAAILVTVIGKALLHLQSRMNKR